jgi:hypothetical protein
LFSAESYRESSSRRAAADGRRSHRAAFNITDKGIAKLVGLKKLRRFYLGGGTPGDEVVKAIAANMPDLESLELGTFGVNGTRITDASVPHLAKLKRLKEAGLNGSKLTDTGLKELRVALPACTIKTK